MKNKKLLLTIAMIMSLVMAVSCSDNGNKTTDPNGPGNTTTPPANQKTPVAIDLSDAKDKEAKTTTLKMVLDDSSDVVKTKADVTFTGADTDATLTVTGFGLVTTDPKNTTTASGKTWQALATGDLVKEDIKLEKGVGKYTVAIDNSKVNGIKAKVQAAKYTVIGVQVKAKKAGKEDKDLTFYVVLVQG